MPKFAICDRLLRVIEWELDEESWNLATSGILHILIDWDGDITGLDVDAMMREMTIIGECRGYSGWAPLKGLSPSEEFFLMFNIPKYKEMIS